MPAAALIHLLLMIGALAVLVPVTGRYLAAVYDGARAPGGTRVGFRPRGAPGAVMCRGDA